jgi:FixJ family two-component response regulator
VLISQPMSRTTPIYVAVVDDDENLCRSLGRLLRATGIHPIVYGSAEEFLADTKHPLFDCLVLDIQLSGMSGIELAQAIIAKGEHTPFIYITAYDDPELRARAEAVGCTAYFRKTDSGSELLDAIRKVIGGTAQ